MAPRTRSSRTVALQLVEALDHGSEDRAELIAQLRAHETDAGCHDCGHELVWMIATREAGLDRVPDARIRRLALDQLERRGETPDPFDGFPQ
jgi:hypothetical protein